jgi:glucose/arabinose dehydrogenase
VSGPRPTQADDLLLTPFIQGLNSPVGIAHAGDGSGRIFVVEQGGDIEVFASNGSSLGTFLDVSPLISTGFEAGLLGLAFDPSYESNGRFYIFYTDTAGDLTVARYTVSANPNVANTNGEAFLTIPHPGYDNHNGGQLAFGPDNYLYIGTGDGGGVGDPDGNGQDNNVLLGKILRIDVSGASGYTSPPTNPLFGATPGLDQIWATGLRNPWRFSFDRQTNDLFIADVGQSNREEVDFQAAGDNELKNYGWSIMEGETCVGGGMCNTAGLTLPIITYDHSLSDCSITGGYRYRGAAQPSFATKYFYGDYCTGRIWAATLSGSSWSSSLLLDSDLNISTFGEDEAGELYVADAGGGIVYRMLEDTTDTDGDTIPDASDNCPSDWNPQQEHADANVRPNGPTMPGDDVTYIMHDNSGDHCDTDDDNDGRSDANESSGTGCAGIVTDPLLVDTDGDRLTDTWECANLTADPPAHPTNPNMKYLGSGSTHSDGDRILDLWEQRGYNSNISSTDSDGDGCHDMVELASVDGNRAIGDPDRLAIARRALGIWPPEPQQDKVFDLDKGGTVNDPDRLFAARAATLPDWLPKSCP